MSPDADVATRPTLVLIHNPRTGGTSMAEILRRNFARTMHLHRPEQYREFFALSAAERARIDVFYGHMPVGLPALLTRPARTMIFLREPIDRAISLYYYARQTPHHPGYQKIAAGATLLDMQVLNNDQTRRLWNYDWAEILIRDDAWWRRPLDGVSEEDQITVAKRNLEACDFVGLYEELADDVRRAATCFGLAQAELPLLNTAAGHPRPADLDLATRTALENFHRLDLQLYEFALRLRERRR